jgi:hypothetical protein
MVLTVPTERPDPKEKLDLKEYKVTQEQPDHKEL